MAFGKKASVQRETTQPTQPTEQTQNQISSQTPNTTFVNLEDGGEDASQQMSSNQGSSNSNSGKPLFDEVVLIDAPKVRMLEELRDGGVNTVTRLLAAHIQESIIIFSVHPRELRLKLVDVLPCCLIARCFNK